MQEVINIALLIFISISVGMYAGKLYFANKAVADVEKMATESEDLSSIVCSLIADFLEKRYLPKWLHKKSE